MKILNIYRYLRNYITVRISGGFTERFINLCNRENVYFWDSVYKDGELTVKMHCKDFKKLGSIRKKSGVKVKIIQKIGLYFWIKDNKKRKVLAVGVAAALFVMFIMNNFVWNIEVIGTENIGEKEVAETLKLTGLTYGTFVPGFDESKVGRDVVNMSDGKILWLAVNVKGSKATIEVRDYTDKYNEENDNNPCNIVADFDGIILSAYTHSGTCISHSGTAVKKGDLLISGVSENENGTVDYLSADGEITAMHTFNNESTFTLNTTANKISIVNIGYRLKFLGLNIPITLNTTPNDYSSVSYTEYLTFDDNIIPIGIEKIINYQEKTKETKKVTIVELLDGFTCDEYDRMKNTTTVESDYVISNTENELTVSGKYDCIDFMGVKSAIIKEN